MCFNLSNNNEVTNKGREIRMMLKREPNKQLFEFDPQGTNEVSEQIMDSYNSGFIDQGTALTNSDNFTETER